MSLIGPRPPIPYEVEHYREWHKQRLETRPGITGLWQVRGRNLLSFDDMVRLDIEYIQEWSFLLDIKIILKTISVVLLGKGY
jgi:lipopolysaccharide/colanic/teichoic acid biosynthesis glycosyltransferase